MNKAQLYWNKVSSDLGIKVRYDVVLPGLETLGKFEILIECFGAKNGMLVIDEFQIIRKSRKEIIALGYGYSTIDSYETYRKANVIQLLRDWSWSCDEPKPNWY